MSYMPNECNVNECFRKYKDTKTGEISRWCGVFGDAINMITPNSKECSLYCDKFFCYRTRQIIEDHDEKYWISDEEMDEDYRRIYEIEDKDVKFSGLSKAGNEDQERERKYCNQDNIVCPYCDYEIEDVWDCIRDNGCDDDDCGVIECEQCEKEFEVTIHKEITFSTYRID